MVARPVLNRGGAGSNPVLNDTFSRPHLSSGNPLQDSLRTESGHLVTDVEFESLLLIRRNAR